MHFVPVNVEFVSKIIEDERPDGIMLAFGGQTALNCGVGLGKKGILDKFGVKVLGTAIKGIEQTEDRDLFRIAMTNVGISVPRSSAVYTLDEARKKAKSIGYPVMLRVAYTLGGKGGGVAFNEYELDEITIRGFANSITHQVLVEEYVGSWKQIEYEVMRDRLGNGETVCNMENVLGMKVHTGDNIVVAPSQTINNKEYHMLRSISLKAAEICGIVGECNVQFALDPKSETYYTIEINARLSRSSALASKATGYPLAYIAAKLALGYTLPELLNKVTGVTTACFEPALDYVVVKMPRWDLGKFGRVTKNLGTQMKSIGEVMAIGRNFEDALQKSIRMIDIGRSGIIADSRIERISSQDILEDNLSRPTDEILFRIVDALKSGMSKEKVSQISNIDMWFISKISNIVDIERELIHKGKTICLETNKEIIRGAKKSGFSDKQIGHCIKISEDAFRKVRLKLGIQPVVRQIDTLAAEWPAKTNYLYLSYDGEKDDITFEGKKKVIVLGAGTYRIGSSVEFDWSTMNMVWALKEKGFDEVITLNCNPETVSTDYDMSDKLYFEELTLERILDIYDKEKPDGIVTCVGGQTPNNLTPKLASYNLKIFGTKSANIDKAEDRSKFSALLDKLGIPQPRWSVFTSNEDALDFARKVGYPILVRPSYVLSGAAMRIIWTQSQLGQFLANAAKVSPEYPLVISTFIQDAQEVEVDGVSDGEGCYIGALIEHIEGGGIHSGDSMMTIPPQRLTTSNQNIITKYTNEIARALQIKGPFNIQFLVKNNEIFVIECNLRASRSMPFVSKLTGVNLMKIAASAILGEKLGSYSRGDTHLSKVGVKVPQFSFMQLEGADLNLGVEMQSTGEVACLGEDFNEALLKALIAAGYKIPEPGGNIFISVGGPELKKRIFSLAADFINLGFKVYATEHTANFLNQLGVEVNILNKIGEPERKPNILDYLVERKIELIINIPSTTVLEKYVDMLEDEYQIRRKSAELGVPVLTTYEGAEAFVNGLKWIQKNNLNDETG